MSQNQAPLRELLVVHTLDTPKCTDMLFRGQQYCKVTSLKFRIFDFNCSTCCNDQVSVKPKISPWIKIFYFSGK